MRTILPKRHPAAEPPRHAQSWHRGPDPDAPISFADIAALPDPDWIGRSQNGGFALDAELLETLELTDWQARIAADWEDVDDQFAELRVRVVAKLMGVERSYGVGMCMLTEPFFAALADLVAEVDDHCGAMLANINAERVLIDQWGQYAKSFMGLVPGATAKVVTR